VISYGPRIKARRLTVLSALMLSMASLDVLAVGEACTRLTDVGVSIATASGFATNFVSVRRDSIADLHFEIMYYTTGSTRLKLIAFTGRELSDADPGALDSFCWANKETE